MSRELARGLTLRTLAFVATLFTLDLAINKCEVLWRDWKLDPSFLFNPMLVMSATLYSASILGLLLSGELSKTIVSNVKITAVFLFLYMVFSNAPTPPALRPLGVLVLVGTHPVVTARVAGVISKDYGGIVLKSLVESLSIFYLSLILRSAVRLVVNTLNIESIKLSLPEKIHMAVLAVSALSILGVFRDYRNPYLSYLGGKFSQLTVRVSSFTIIMLLLFYFSDLRPAASNLISNNLVIVYEWAAVCLMVYAFYRKIRSYASKRLVETRRLEGWFVQAEKVLQRNGDIVEASKLAEDFVERGRKAGLLSNIVATLVKNGVPTGKIETIIQELADYKDGQLPMLTLKWELKNLEREEKRRRLRVLMSTLARAADELGLASLRQTVEEEVDGFEPRKVQGEL
jgi:hypothetical protein